MFHYTLNDNLSWKEKFEQYSTNLHRDGNLSLLFTIENELLQWETEHGTEKKISLVMTVQIWPARYIPVAINDNSRKYVRAIMYSTDTDTTSF